MAIPNARKTLLSNGLKVLTEEIPAMRSVALGIMVGAGSVNEGGKESGISHFIEHMSFKGTAKRSAYEIVHALDGVGGKMNAYTGKEYTMYYAVVLDRHLDTALDVLSDMLLNSLHDPGAIELEKGVVLEEIKMYEDTPDEQIHDYFTEKILHGHPLGRPIIGREQTVKAVNREEIKRYGQRWYSPKNSILSVAGAIPPNIIDQLTPYFEKWQGEEAAAHLPLPEIQSGLNLKPKKTEQVHLCLGVKGISQVDEERYAFSILDNILGGSMSSRLFQEIREKRGLAYAIYSTLASYRDSGLAYVYAGTGKENLEKVVELVLAEFKKIKKEGITAEELTRAKEYLKGTLVLGLESTSSRMSWLARSEYYYHKVKTIDEVFEMVDRVTRDDIIRLAKQYFRDEYLTLAVIGDLDKLPFKEIHCE